ncbi:MAD1_2 [Sanghuangporus sanghuang]
MSDHRVWCFLIDHEKKAAFGNAFSVIVGPDACIEDLTKKAKEARTVDLEHVDAARLTVWRCTDPGIDFGNMDSDDFNKRLKEIFSPDEKKVKKLNPKHGVEQLADETLLFEIPDLNALRQQIMDALKKANFKVQSVKHDPDLEPLHKLPSHVLEATSSEGVPVVAKLVRSEDSDELSLLEELNAQRSPHNHVIPLMETVELGLGGFLIILPKKTSISNLSPCVLDCEFVRLSHQLVEGVAFLHRHKIAHLDIKPDNLVSDSESRCLYIIDFAIAIRCMEIDEMIELSCGTPKWSAPEIVHGDKRPLRPFNPIRADLWSCGAVLAFFGTGKDRAIDSLTGLLLNYDPRRRPLLHELIDEEPDFWSSGRLLQALALVGNLKRRCSSSGGSTPKRPQLDYSNTRHASASDFSPAMRRQFSDSSTLSSAPGPPSPSSEQSSLGSSTNSRVRDVFCIVSPASMSSGARLGPTREFRPTRTTRATAASDSASGTGTATGTNPRTAQTRARTSSRPPSTVGAAVTIGRPGTASPASRPGSAPFSLGASRTTTAFDPSSRASAPSASSTTAGGLKRKTRAASGENENEKEPAIAKRPALSGTFSAQLAQSSVDRQLLVLRTQVADLENSVSNKQRDIIRLEGDLRLLAGREEEEREARRQAEQELAAKTTECEAELSALKRKLVDLEADHDDLSDAYSNLSHSTTSQINTLELDVSTRDDRNALLESQLKDVEARVRKEQERARELEEALQLMPEEGSGVESIQENDSEQEQEGGGGDGVHPDDDRDKVENTSMRIEFKEPQSSIDESSSVEVEDETRIEEIDEDADADADGEAEPDEVSIAPTGPNTFYEGRPETSMSENRSSTLHRIVYSPGVRSVDKSTAARSRSTSAASSAVGSEVSKAMSISFDGPNLQGILCSPETPTSITSNSRLDPLLRVRRQLGLASPGRRRSSLGVSRDREKDNEIIRAELARQTSHIAQLESINARLMSDVARLKARAEGTEVLREEKRELERRVEGMEALRAHVAELETAADEFAQREKEWRARLAAYQQADDENSTPDKTPVSVTQQLTALRKVHTALMDDHGELKVSSKGSGTYQCSRRGGNTARELERLYGDVDRLQGALARKERERVLLETDVTFLRSLVSSYKNEEVADSSIDGGEQSNGTEKLEQRISQLESLLMEYKFTIQSLEQELDQLRHSGGNVTSISQEQKDQLLSNAAVLEEALKDSQAELKNQTDRVEELEQQLFDLGGEIGAGRHIPPATRVLSLRQNPAQEWADTRQILKTMSEKRRLRLQEVFTAKSKEFREAIELILGVKLAFYPNGQVRLTSIYDLNATYVFQPSRSRSEDAGMKMQLVAKGDRCPEELESLMKIWIHDEMCIPCFMSSITRECYDKRKMDRERQDSRNIIY